MNTKDFNIDDFITSTAPISEPTKPTQHSLTTQSTEKSMSVVPIPQSTAVSRTSTKQRKASLDEYREAFMVVPKITDRQPVFVSRSTRDRIDEVVRRFGERSLRRHRDFLFLTTYCRIPSKPIPKIWNNGNGYNQSQHSEQTQCN